MCVIEKNSILDIDIVSPLLTVWPELLCCISVWWQWPRGPWWIWPVTAILWPGSGWPQQPHAASRPSASPGEPPDRPWRRPWSFRSSTGPGLRWSEAECVDRRPEPAPDSELLEGERGTCWRTPRTSIWKHRVSSEVSTFYSKLIIYSPLIKRLHSCFPGTVLILHGSNWGKMDYLNLRSYFWSSLPGWKTCSTDPNGLQQPTGPQLLHCPLGVKPNTEKMLCVI